MKVALAWFVCLYLVALHTSMASMEVFAWLTVVTATIYQVQRRNFATFHANRWLNIWFVLFTLCILIGLLVNPLHRPFMFQFGFMRWTLVLWGLVFAIQEIWNEEFERRLVTLWMVLVGVTGAYAGLECFTGLDFVRKNAVLFQGEGIYKATGWFSESLTFAYSFGLSVFAQAQPAWAKRSHAWAILVGILGGLGIVSAVSRGAWLAAIICVLIYLAFNRPVWTVPAAGLFFYALSKFLIWYSAGFGGKIEGMEQMKVDHSSGVRLDLWQGYLSMWWDHPWFGVGLAQGDKFLPEYFAKLGIHQDFLSHAHNNFLQMLGGTGVFGFICYCAIVFIFLRKAWRLRNVTAWGWSLFLAQLYMQLGGLTEANFIDGEVNHMLTFTWALLLVLEARFR